MAGVNDGDHTVDGYPVGAVARLAGVSVRTLHHYDQIGRRHDLLAAIEKEMEALQMGISLTPEEQFEIFGTDKAGAEWAEEAERRWGGTPGLAQYVHDAMLANAAR